MLMLYLNMQMSLRHVDYVGLHFETWDHVYWHCAKAQILWGRIEALLPINLKGLTSLNVVLLPVNAPEVLLIIIVLTKLYIHTCIFCNNIPNFEALSNLVKLHCRASINYFSVQRKNVRTSWSTVYRLFDPP